MRLQIDNRALVRLEHDLGRESITAVKHAQRAALNDLAFDARRQAVVAVKRKMTLRNTWTLRSIQVRRATIGDLTSRVGSIAPYMETQEDGGSRAKKGKHGVPIPTKAARVGRSKRRVVRRQNWQRKLSVARINARRFRRIRNKRQRTAAIAAQARREGKRYVFLDTVPRRKGVYDMRGKRMTMLWSVSRPIVTIRKRPWLEPSVDQSITRGLRFYRFRLQQQWNRRGMFR